MNLRHYDPATHRFASPDPVVANVYNTQAWNRYSYVQNNPTTFVDPTGAFGQGANSGVPQGLVDRGEPDWGGFGGGNGFGMGFGMGSGQGFALGPALGRLGRSIANGWNNLFKNRKSANNNVREYNRPPPPIAASLPSLFQRDLQSGAGTGSGVLRDLARLGIPNAHQVTSAALSDLAGTLSHGVRGHYGIAPRFEFPRLPIPDSGLGGAFANAAGANHVAFVLDSAQLILNVPVNIEDGVGAYGDAFDNFRGGRYLNGLDDYAKGLGRFSEAILGITGVAGAFESAAARGVGRLPAAAGGGGAVAQRATYLQGVRDLGAFGRRMLRSGISHEQVARVLVPVRNALKVQVRGQGGAVSRWGFELRNLFKYGDRVGPSADQLFRRYGSWEKVTDALTRTNRTVNLLTGN